MYLSEVLLGSCSQMNTFPTSASHSFLYKCQPQLQQHLSKSSCILVVCIFSVIIQFSLIQTDLFYGTGSNSQSLHIHKSFLDKKSLFVLGESIFLGESWCKNFANKFIYQRLLQINLSGLWYFAGVVCRYSVYVCFHFVFVFCICVNVIIPVQFLRTVCLLKTSCLLSYVGTLLSTCNCMYAGFLYKRSLAHQDKKICTIPK